MSNSKNNKIFVKIKEGISLLLILIISFYLIINFIYPNKVVDIFGFKPYVVSSNSMKPKFQKGDIVIITRVNTNNLKNGSIIAVQKRNKMRIAHFLAEQRINDNHELVFRTKPYGVEQKNYWDYESIRRNQIIGRVDYIIPYLGHVVLYLNTLNGIITSIIVLTIIVLLKREKNK